MSTPVTLIDIIAPMIQFPVFMRLPDTMSINRQQPAPVPPTTKEALIYEGVPIKNISYTGVRRVELSPADSKYEHEYEKATTCKNKKGVMPMTKKEQEYEREASFKIIKQFTKKIFTMDLSKFSIPVAYSEPRSFIERTADLFSFIAHPYAERAYKESDPVLRLRTFSMGLIGTLHLCMQSKKPWNPIIGETLIGEWPNGARIYGEQISHHPAMTAIDAHGPEGQWRCHAVTKFSVDIGMTEIVVKQRGLYHFSYQDGTQYEFEYPDISAIGVIAGDRVVRIRGGFTIRDLTNDLLITVMTNPKEDKKKGIPKGTYTSLYGEITRGEDPTPLLSYYGDYCGQVKQGDTVLWDIHEKLAHKPNVVVPDDILLPSDCRYRLDRNSLIANDIDLADKTKAALEELQRKDAKLRTKVETTE